MSANPRREIGLKDLDPLKKALAECEGETFTYRGMEIDRRYAEYLIKWLQGAALGLSIREIAGGDG
jgi:hypothetical protein